MNQAEFLEEAVVGYGAGVKLKGGGAVSQRGTSVGNHSDRVRVSVTCWYSRVTVVRV